MRRVILSLLVALSVEATAQLTPSQYREEVREYSWSLKNAETKVEYYDERVAYERVSLLPTLSMSGRFSSSFREGVNGAKRWGVAAEPQIIQTLYSGGVNRANIAQAELYSDVARCDADYTQLEVNYAADYAYWNLWAMNRYYDAQLQYVEIIGEELRVIERRYDEGYISKGDLLMIEARLSEAEYSLTSAEQSRQTAQNNLNVLRGVDPSVEVSLSDIRPDSMSLPLRATIEEVIMRRPDYEALRLTELAAEAATKAVRGVYNPQLYGGVSGSWRSNTPNYTGSTTIDGAVFVELSVPIFHFGERRKAVAASRKSEQISAINSSILLDSITGDESNAWVSVVESRAQMSAAARSLQIASENLDISTYSYNEGEVSIVELLTAQISWIQIYTNAIDSEYRYQIALAYYGFVAAQ